MQANPLIMPNLGDLPVEMLPNGVLAEQRRAAFATAQQQPLPIWRRTDLKTFRLDDMQPVYAGVEIVMPDDAQGVYIADLQTALQEQPELVTRYYGTALEQDFNKFVALNTALAQDGIVVHVPRNVELSAPITVRYHAPAAGQAIFPRTLVVTEANSRVTLIEEFVSDDLPEFGLVVPAAELFALDGSEIRFVSLQTLGHNVYQLGAQRAIVGKDARVWWLAGAVGASVQHVDMQVNLQGNGAGLEWYGFSFGTGDQQILWGPRVNHIGLSTEAQIQWKSAVSGNAYVVFDGMIDIEKGAQGTNSDLHDDVLHLSDKARSDSIPGLEIDANEVKAGHGSTSGQVDEEQVFYLMARGLHHDEAVKMIVQGFFAAVIERIPLDEVQERVLGLIETKM